MKTLTTCLALLALVTLSVAAPSAQTAPARAPDITGKWTSTFETQIGEQTCSFDFVVKDGKLTGKLKNSLGEAATDVLEGSVVGDVVKFAENFSFQGMDIRITYTGKIVSADEIKFTRNVAEFATEELVAKRVKP